MQKLFVLAMIGSLREAVLALPLIKQEVTAQSIAVRPEWPHQIEAALVNFAQALK